MEASKQKVYISTSLLILTTIGVLLFTTCQKPDFKRVAALETISVNNISTETAVVVGNIIDLGEGLKDYGVFYSKSSNAQNGTKVSLGKPNGTGQFSAKIEGLHFGSQYYTRCYGFDEKNYTYGDEKTFTTQSKTKASIELNDAEVISVDSARISFTIRDFGYEVDSLQSVGLYIDTLSNMSKKRVIELGSLKKTTTLDTLLTALTPGQTYYYKAFAQNEAGTIESDVKTFTTKDGVPAFTEITITEITATSAKIAVEITDNGGAEISERGFVWGWTENPTLQINVGKMNVESGLGSFNLSLSNLKADSTYFVRSYAINNTGVYYGSYKELTTKNGVPTFSEITITDITAISANVLVEITDDGTAEIIKRGFVWSGSENPTLEANMGKTEAGNDIGSYTFSLSALEIGKTYYVRSYAVNAVGTHYGDDYAFTTLTGIPKLTVVSITDITAISAKLTVRITDDGAVEITKRGFVWGTTNEPTLENSAGQSENGSGVDIYSQSITALEIGKKYYVRWYAVNAAGTHYGDTYEFTTLAGIPSFSDVSVTEITATSAKVSIEITDDGGVEITKRGFVWGITNEPTLENSTGQSENGSGVDIYSQSLTALEIGKKYYVRSYAVNAVGTHYSKVFKFSPLITDIDGNTYKTVTIGTQTWMAENLKATRYANGTTIKHITDNIIWGNLGDYDTEKAYCFYNNDESLGYGALYTYAAATNGDNSGNKVQGVCPTGWHLPSDAEWTTLEMYLGMSQSDAVSTGWRGTIEGKKLKATSGWIINGNGTDEVGFTALAGGYRSYYNGAFGTAGSYGYWWSSTQYNSNSAYNRRLYYYNSTVDRYYSYKSYGRSVRCLRD